MATDSAAESDLSSTTIAGFCAHSEVAVGFALRNADGTPSKVKVSSVFKNLDGSRRMRLRHDTQEVANLTLSAAYGEEILKDVESSHYGVALRYADMIGTVKVAAALRYAVGDRPVGDDVETLTASALHEPSGVSVTLAAGSEVDSGNDLYAKLGWQGDLIAAGKTALAAEYVRSNDLGGDGTGGNWGLMAVQTFKEASLEVCLGYRE